MAEKYYLHIGQNYPDDLKDYGFYVEGIHDITDADIPITTEDWRYYLDHANGQTQLKKTLPDKGGLFSYLELEPYKPPEPTITNEDKKTLETIEIYEQQQQDNTDKTLAMVESYEQQEQENTDTQLLLAAIMEGGL